MRIDAPAWTPASRWSAAENFWGSIAAQLALAGDRADVRSIVTNPDTDPHSYDPTAADARAIAASQVAIVNGIGYDGWALHLLAANPDRTPGRAHGRRPARPRERRQSAPVVLAARRSQGRGGDLGGLREGRSGRRPVFRHAEAPLPHALALLVRHAAEADSAAVRRHAGGLLGEHLRAARHVSRACDSWTPYSFAKTVAEGGDVSAQDTRTVERQLSRRLVRVWVFNSQNVSPEIDHLNAIARAEHIPIATVTETLSPANVDFEQWQVAELQQLRAALAEGAGR